MPAGALPGKSSDPPGELLVEQRVERPGEDPYARRVNRDGSVYEYTSVTASYEGGEWRFGSQPLEWRALAQLSPGSVAELEGAIRRDGVADLPPEHLPEGTGIGGSNVVWSVELDGRRHTVALVGVGGEQPAPFGELDRLLQLEIARAVAPDDDEPVQTSDLTNL
jgi:hypothetical protein